MVFGMAEPLNERLLLPRIQEAGGVRFMTSTAIDPHIAFLPRWVFLEDQSSSQWEFQDPKMEVLYHIRPYFMGMFPYIGLKNRPYIW